MFRCKKLLSVILFIILLFTIKPAIVDAFEGGFNVQPMYYGAFSVQYAPPQADAGEDQIVVIGNTVILSGLNSTDPDGDPVTYIWSLVSTPIGSAASIYEPSEGSAIFTPDVIGDYQVSLVVNDGTTDSSPAVVTVSAFKTFRHAARKIIANTISDIKFLRGFTPDVFKGRNKVRRKKTAKKLIKKFKAISRLIKRKKIKKARNKLLLLLARVDGCTLRGTPDLIDSGYKVDLIIDCDAQNEIYDLIVVAIDMLTSKGIEDYNASFSGTWISKFTSGSEAGNKVYFIFDGNGGITEWGAFDFISSSSSYHVQADGSFTITVIDSTNKTTIVTGQFTSETSATWSIPGESGTFEKVADTSTCQGIWSGTLTESGTSNVYNISFVVNSSGVVTAFTGFTSPVTGKMFSAPSGDVAAHFYTGETNSYYQFSLFCTLSGNSITGNYGADGTETGTVNLTKQTLYVSTQHHYLNNYFLGISFRYMDTSTISSVDVTGPNINTVWKAQSDHWVVSLTARPTVGDTYTIQTTFTDTTTKDEQYVVNGLNDNFAVITLPSDGSTITTTTPTFTWQEASNITSYSLLISGIWNIHLNSGTSSVVFNYDGTASAPLQSGQTYEIILHTFDSNDNQATTQSTFTVQ